MKKYLKYTLQLLIRSVKLFFLLVHFTFDSTTQILRRLPENNRKILFTLDDDRLYTDNDGSGRYAYLILNRFCEAGYNVYFYKEITFRGYYRLGKYGRYIYSIKNLKLLKKIPERTDDIVYAFDHPYKNLLGYPWEKLAYVNVLKPASCKIGDTVWIPYFMHAIMHKFNLVKKISAFRNAQRKLKIFFTGNTAPGYYNNPSPKRYGKLTRIEGINVLRKMGDRVKYSENVEELYNLLDSDRYANECFILSTDHTFPISPWDWFGILSRCDFFVCLSGTDLPMCHNVIESMAVGTIPIISYYDWFFPPLEHMKNAIVYSDQADMIKKINEVFNMSNKEIGRLRENVITYYDSHLTTESFINKFRNTNGNISTIMLHPQLIPTEQEANDGQAVSHELRSIPKDYFTDENQSHL